MYIDFWVDPLWSALCPLRRRRGLMVFHNLALSELILFFECMLRSLRLRDFLIRLIWCVFYDLSFLEVILLSISLVDLRLNLDGILLRHNDFPLLK